jgi:lytic murein transglycosylase
MVRTAAVWPKASRPAHVRGARLLFLAVIACLALIFPATSGKSDDGFKAWLAAFRTDAEQFGISRVTFDAAFRGIEPDLSLPDLVIPGRSQGKGPGQAEFTRPPQAYINTSQIIRLANTGRALKAKHADALARIEREIGVEAEAVLAIWGRETAFGDYRLPHSAIRALATQAYLGRRKEMFRIELLHALRLIQDGVVTREDLRSSWAGAVGLPQLMPSEFDMWAHDLDGDGRKDIWNSVPDALATIARQLAGKGWVKGQTWGYEVRMPASGKGSCALEGPENARPLSEWAALGFTRTQGRQFPADQLSAEAYLMSPGGAYGPAFLVLENYRVIRRYNMSDLYAVFVGHLADRIAGGGDFETPWQDISQLSSASVEEIQRRLKSKGFGIDKIDGKVGSNTRWQIGSYQTAQRLKVDCWPTAGLLKHLQANATP